MSPTLLMSQQQQQQQMAANLNNTTTNQETFIQPILGVAPLGKTPLTKEQSQQLAILDCAHKKLPHPSDTERIRNYLPRVNVNTPPYYPTTPPVGHDSLDFLCKLSSDTLFFMFYYMEVNKRTNKTKEVLLETTAASFFCVCRNFSQKAFIKTLTLFYSM